MGKNPSRGNGVSGSIEVDLGLRDQEISRSRGSARAIGCAALAFFFSTPARSEDPAIPAALSSIAESIVEHDKNDYQWDIETGEVYLQSQKYVPYAFHGNDSKVRPSPAIGKTLFVGYRWHREFELRFGGFVPIRQEVVEIRETAGRTAADSMKVADTFDFSKAVSAGVGHRFTSLPMTAKGWLELWGTGSTIIPIARGLKYYLIPTVEGSIRFSFKDGAGIGIGFGYAGIVSTGTAFARLGVSKRF